MVEELQARRTSQAAERDRSGHACWPVTVATLHRLSAVDKAVPPQHVKESLCMHA